MGVSPARRSRCPRATYPHSKAPRIASPHFPPATVPQENPLPLPYEWTTGSTAENVHNDRRRVGAFRIG